MTAARRFLDALTHTGPSYNTTPAPTPSNEQQLLHLVDRMRRGVILAPELDDLHAGIVATAARAERAERVARSAARDAEAALTSRLTAEARVTELEAESVTLRDALAHCRHKPRVTELEAEVARLRTAPAEHCGNQMPLFFTTHAQRTECVLHPGHEGSHADESGARWRWTDDRIRDALDQPQQPTNRGCGCHNSDELCSGCGACPDVCRGCDGPKATT